LDTWDILALIDERRKFKNSQDDFGKSKYKQFKNRINREAIAAKNIWLEERCNEVEILLKSNKIEQAFKLINTFFKNKTKRHDKIRDENGNLILDDEGKVRRWKNILRSYTKELIESPMSKTVGIRMSRV